MKTSINPIPFFLPSNAKAVEKRWSSGKTIVRVVPHNAIRWIKKFFFLRPFDGVRVSLAPMECEERMCHRKKSAWRVLGSTKGQAPNPALSVKRQKDVKPGHTGTAQLWLPRELSNQKQSRRLDSSAREALQPLRIEE